MCTASAAAAVRAAVAPRSPSLGNAVGGGQLANQDEQAQVFRGALCAFFFCVGWPNL